MTHRTRYVSLVMLGVVLAAAPLLQAQSGRSWPSSRVPRPLTAREVTFPPYQLMTLPNGLRVVVVTHDEQPVVSMRLIVGAGAARDPAAKPGVAAMTAQLLDQGTAAHSARELAETIESAGGRLETGLGRDLTFAHVVVMKDSLALGMQLLAEVVRTPALAAEELERQRQQTLSALQVSYQDPEYLANLLFARLVYGASPYGSPGNGTPESLQRITREDLVAFHRTYFAPNNGYLAVVGDLSAAEAMRAVTAAFGDWERREVPVFEPAAAPSPARRLLVVDKPDAVQTEIRVGQLGIPRGNPDFLAVDLAMNILGGEGANRLHRVLRAERGLTYGASADTETFRRSGRLVAQTSTRSDATAEALRLVVDEYWRLRREGVGETEMAEAKAYLTGHFPLTIETPDDIATQVLNVLFYDLPLEELQTFRQRVNALGIDDVERAVSRYLSPDRLSVVLVGNASAFVGELRGAGFGNYQVVRLSELDVSAADFRRKDAVKGVAQQPSSGGRWPSALPNPLDALAAFPAGGEGGGRAAAYGTAGPAALRPAAAAQAPDETAAGLVKRAIDAKGGLDRLKAVKTLWASAVTTVMLPSGPQPAQTTTYIEYPNRFRVEAHLPIGVVVQVYAGEGSVWAQDPRRGVIEVPEAGKKEFKASVDRDLIQLLLRAASGELTARIPETASGTTDVLRAVELSGPGLDPVTLYIEPKSGLVLRESYRLPGDAGTADEVFADYRDVDGIKIAFKATVRRNNLPVTERVATDVKVNATLPPGLFDRPPQVPGK